MRVDTTALESPLSVAAIRSRLAAGVVGCRLELYHTVASTNAALRELAREGAPEGTVVLAETQTGGRGRAGKPWFSPPGVNLYASVLFRPAIAAGGAAVFSFMASLAVTDAVRELGLAPAIKWPNDVLVGGRKVAGTLAEAAVTGERVEHVILGLGVNLNVGAEALATALGDAGRRTTSLREALGRPVDRNEFAATCLGCLEEWRIVHAEQGDPALLQAWRDLDIVSGRRVQVREGAQVFDGRARGVDAAGHLEVEDVRGRIHRVVAGDIRLLE